MFLLCVPHSRILWIENNIRMNNNFRSRMRDVYLIQYMPLMQRTGSESAAVVEEDVRIDAE